MSYKSRFSRLSAGAKCPMFRAYSCSVSGVSKLPDAISLAVCSAGGMYSGCSSFVSGISGCTAGAMSVAALRLRSCFLARRLTLRIIPMYAQFTRVDVPPREIRGSGYERTGCHKHVCQSLCNHEQGESHGEKWREAAFGEASGYVSHAQQQQKIQYHYARSSDKPEFFHYYGVNKVAIGLRNEIALHRVSRSFSYYVA